MYDTNAEVPEEHKLLLRQLKAAASTFLELRTPRAEAMSLFELALVHETLARTKNNRSHAAKLLGVHRNTLTRKLPISERGCRERYDTVNFQSRALRG